MTGKPGPKTISIQLAQSPEVARRDVESVVVELARERLALHEKFDFEAGQQDLVEHPDGQLGLADRQAPHASRPPPGSTLDILTAPDYSW